VRPKKGRVGDCHWALVPRGYGSCERLLGSWLLRKRSSHVGTDRAIAPSESHLVSPNFGRTQRHFFQLTAGDFSVIMRWQDCGQPLKKGMWRGFSLAIFMAHVANCKSVKMQARRFTREKQHQQRADFHPFASMWRD
jgi:hypothetical protein